MLCSTRAKEATGNTVMPILQHQPPFSWASLSDSTASLLSSLLATPAHTPSHSRCWNSLPFLMRVPECLIKVVQPSKSESFTVGRANIYSINKRWVPAGADTAGHWDTENMKLVIGQHETAWHQTALVIPRHHIVSDNTHNVSFNANQEGKHIWWHTKKKRKPNPASESGCWQRIRKQGPRCC